MKNSKKWLIIGGAALAVIVIVLVLVLWVFKGDDDITFGLRASFTMEEAIDAMKKKGYELDEKASYTSNMSSPTCTATGTAGTCSVWNFP